MARLLSKDGGFWIYHKNKIDLSTLFSQPEEKLWLVVQDYQGGLGNNQQQVLASMEGGTGLNDDEVMNNGLKRGFKLEKNSVIKFGRVRLRVRDIDYPYAQKQFQQLPNFYENMDNKMQEHKPDKGKSPATTRREAAYLEDNANEEGGLTQTNRQAIQASPGEFTNLNNIIEEDRGTPSNRNNSGIKKRKGPNGKDLINDELRGKTKLTEESEAVCRICWGTENEDIQNANSAEEEDLNPLISPCKCTGTMGLIHVKCLRGWLETKRTRKEHRKQVIYKFKKLDCELCKQNFPFKITYGNKIVDIVGVDKPEKNYIILESLSSEQ